jgi:hypothetical protein
MKNFLPLFLCLYFSSCITNRQRQVWLGPLQQTHLADKERVVRVYFDKQGNLYPGTEDFVPAKNFFDPLAAKKTFKEKPLTANLETYFTSHTAALEKLFLHWCPAAMAAGLAKDSFYAVQYFIRKNYAHDLEKAFALQKEKILVLMIHGFNSPNPTGEYQMMRNAIRKQGYDKGNFVYLEVYWDGLTANQGNPVFEGIWKKALQNSAYAALGLRRLLTILDPDIQIVIITHSLGASVGTGALFNAETKWTKRGFKNVGKKLGYEYGQNFFDSLRSIPAPRQECRLGMIAPAIPGYNSFIDFNKRNPEITPAQNNISRAVVGYNVNDFAVTKRLFKVDMARYFGSTSLGCNKYHKGKTEMQRTEEALLQNGYSAADVRQILWPVDYSRYGKKIKSEEHGLYYYLSDTLCTDEFLKKLFE